uniref:Uncharacterized protein n=1 Tax=Panagrolaimus sp. JU765 TaxID=591449 RepID=A0AC34PV12_9BILA
MCGTTLSSFIPCVSRKHANVLFRSCCEKFVDVNCLDLCRFETRRSDAVKAFKSAMEKKCSLTNMSAILYCASQNRNNKQCCNHLKLGTTTRSTTCLKFCDPSKNMIGTLTAKDLVCLQNWNVLMFCHLSGLT